MGSNKKSEGNLIFFIFTLTIHFSIAKIRKENTRKCEAIHATKEEIKLKQENKRIDDSGESLATVRERERERESYTLVK